MFSVSSFSAEKLTPAEVKDRYHIVEGEYNLLSSSSQEDCIAGEYKILNGSNGVVSLSSAGGLLAKNIESAVSNFNEKGCSMNYTTVETTSGFKNVEAVNCAAEKGKGQPISYTRTVELTFGDKSLKYRLSTHRVLESKKSEVTCRLKLSEKK